MKLPRASAGADAGLGLGGRTNSGGGGDEVDKPEEEEAAAEAAGPEDDGGGDEGQEEEDGHLLHHLEQQVRARPVQPVVALPAHINTHLVTACTAPKAMHASPDSE